VETYRLRLMRKLGFENLPALVKYAIRHGIITLD
jgi:DNA-binding CsgD family transcriptional regulator